MKRIRKSRIILLALVMLCTIMLSGCDKVPDTAAAEIAKVFQERAQENKNHVETLCNAGLITEQEKNNWIASIDSLVKEYVDIDNMEVGDLTGMLKGVTYIDEDLIAAGWDEETAFKIKDKSDSGGDTDNLYKGMKEDEWIAAYIPALIAETNKQNLVACVSGTEVEPIPIVQTDMQDIINERLRMPIYVLKSQSDLANVDGNLELDGIIEMIEQAVADPNNIDDGILANYFQNSGQNLLSSDIQVIKETVPNGGSSNSLGTDAVITQFGDTAMKVRLVEFNPDVLDMLYKITGSGSTKFIVSNGKLYLMEYPVYAVSSLDRIDNSEYNIETTETDMYISLVSKTVYRKDSSSGKIGEIIIPEGYLHLSGAKSNSAPGMSSFILWGTENKINLSFDFSESSGLDDLNDLETIDSGFARIVLRDYLEGTYAPGLVNNENIVVFGRRIRINKFRNTDEGDSQGCLMTEPFAYYIDDEGNKLSEMPYLYIDDVADVSKLNSSNPVVSYIQNGGVNKDHEGIKKADEVEDGVKTNLGRLSEVEWKASDNITVGTAFPGSKIGRADSHNINRPLWYAIPVTKSFFETALYNEWIISTDPSASLNWWNSWLAENGYNYQINATVLEEWLMGNYSFELRQQGIIVLDLGTIAKIQEEYNELDETATTKTIRTIFIILGWVLILLSMITLAAWAVDVNIDMGFNILEKITFGNWVAIKYDDEIPYKDYSGKSYVTLKRLIISVLLMILIGIILITIPVTNIAVKLIEIFGGIADVISNLITGIRS